MISRCPSCGAPAPDEARLCRACGWDFVTNKKGEKAADPSKKPEPVAEKPKPVVPPAAGLALPPARGGTADVPATGLGMARLPKVEPGPSAAPGAPDENPFALPVARNLGPKPGESLFAPPPVAAEPRLPEARPKEAPLPEPEEPARKEPAPPKEDSPKPPPAKKAPPKIEPPKPAPKAKQEAADEEDVPSSIFSLPSSTKEIIVDPSAKRAQPEAPAEVEEMPAAEPPRPAPAAAKKAAPPTDTKPPAKRQTAVYLAALAGGALGLFSVGAIFMMLRSDPQAAARPAGSSPFGKRNSGDATIQPVLDEPASAPAEDGPISTSIPAPRRPIPAVEPPAPAPVAAPVALPPAPAPAPVPQAPKVTAKANPNRPTATFAPTPRARPAPRPAAVAKKLGPQWVFEGVVYDLLTTQGVFGVRLVFLDAEDNEVAVADAGEGGQYRVSMDAGPSAGYTLRVVHDDYSGKHIDELDSTSSVRKADLEQRKFLMQAGARSLPWIGTVGKPVRRDMALVPKSE